MVLEVVACLSLSLPLFLSPSPSPPISLPLTISLLSRHHPYVSHLKSVYCLIICCSVVSRGTSLLPCGGVDAGWNPGGSKIGEKPSWLSDAVSSSSEDNSTPAGCREVTYMRRAYAISLQIGVASLIHSFIRFKPFLNKFPLNWKNTINRRCLSKEVKGTNLHKGISIIDKIQHYRTKQETSENWYVHHSVSTNIQIHPKKSENFIEGKSATHESMRLQKNNQSWREHHAKPITDRHAWPLCHVPSIGSCSQFCLILQPHRVAVPFPPTFASPWRNNFFHMSEQLCWRQNLRPPLENDPRIT